jgi:hypothetical protein
MNGLMILWIIYNGRYSNVFFEITSITLAILAIPCCFASIVMAFGDNKRIKFFDESVMQRP